MRYPKFLTEGGKIGFIAPGFGCDTEPYRTAFGHALEHFASLGHGTILGPNVYRGTGTGISAAPGECARELMEAYLSPETQVLISCGGSELMCEILDEVDFERLRQAEPKWFMGYSDNTNITFLLTTLCDTAAVYGPCASAFGMEPWHPAIREAYELLKGGRMRSEGYDRYEMEAKKDEEHPLEPYHVTQPRQIYVSMSKSGGSARLFSEGERVQFSGRLIGGCLDCLANLPGTRYDKVADFAERYAGDGLIWFLESCDLNVFGIRRAIWQLKQAGWFRHVRGFLIGRPLNGEEAMGLDRHRAVTELLSEYQVPVVMDLDIGHVPPMMPVISGALVQVSCRGQKFELLMKAG